MPPRTKRVVAHWANELGPHGLGFAMLFLIWKLIVSPTMAQQRADTAQAAIVAKSVEDAANASREAAQASLTAARILESVSQQLREAGKDK